VVCSLIASSSLLKLTLLPVPPWSRRTRDATSFQPHHYDDLTADLECRFILAGPKGHSPLAGLYLASKIPEIPAYISIFLILEKSCDTYVPLFVTLPEGRSVLSSVLFASEAPTLVDHFAFAFSFTSAVFLVSRRWAASSLWKD
jgi:hypothetical protein